jgi:hypothetical protein
MRYIHVKPSFFVRSWTLIDTLTGNAVACGISDPKIRDLLLGALNAAGAA